MQELCPSKYIEIDLFAYILTLYSNKSDELHHGKRLLTHCDSRSSHSTLVFNSYSLRKALILRLPQLTSFDQLAESSRGNSLAGGSARRTVELNVRS